MAFVRKIKASLVRQDSADYIGEETYLFYDIDTGCIRQYDGTPGGKPACIEGLGGGGFNGLGLWRYRTATGSTPSSGQLQFNNTTIASATELYIHNTNDNGTDMSAFLGSLSSGSLLYIQVQDDSTQFVVVEIGTSSLAGSVYTFPILNIETEGTAPTNNTQVALVASGTGSGGGGSSITVQDEGISLTTDVTLFNFVGDGVTVTEPVADQVEVSVPGPPAGLALTTINGQPMLTVEDTTRANKILSVGEQVLVWSDNKLNDQDWLRLGDAKHADSGYVMDFDGTIVYASAHCRDTNGNSKEIRIYVDAVDIAGIGTLTGGTNIEINNTTLDVNFSQGQKIRLRAIDGSGDDIKDTVVKLTVKWRG